VRRKYGSSVSAIERGVGREGGLYLDPSCLVNDLDDVEVVGDLRREVLNRVEGEVCDQAHGHLGLPVQAVAWGGREGGREGKREGRRIE